jgi:hypothetical protein
MAILPKILKKIQKFFLPAVDFSKCKTRKKQSAVTLKRLQRFALLFIYRP